MAGRWIAAAITSIALAVAAAPSPPAQALAPATSTGSGDQITELIVSYKAGVTPSEAPGIATGDAAVAADVTLETGDDIGFGFRTVRLSAPVSEAEAQRLATALSKASGVAHAEPNSIVTLTASQDPAPSWGLDRIDQANLPLSSSYTYPDASTGAGVTAYVIDTGIKAGHADFGARLKAGYYVPNTNPTTPSAGEALTSSDDCNGHGTHVAGIIGGTTYGVAKAVDLVPVRVFGCTGSTTIEAIVAGINWVTSNHAANTPAVANMSLRSGASTALDTAVQALIDDGVTVVVASGNDASNSCNYSPARVPAAITVNASDSADAAASFTNYGSCSDLYAPGVDITSDWNTSTTATNIASGTSMASPHVAGAVARYLQAHASDSPAQVQAAILAAATPVTFAPASSDPDLLLFASPGAATAPGAPTGVAAGAATAAADVSWSAPASDGGAAITGYTASAYATSSGGAAVATCTTSTLSCTIAGLAGGTAYYVEVVATNSQGDGPASSPRSPVTPSAASAPSAPLSVAAASGNTTAEISWSAPTSDGGTAITGYTALAYAAASGGSPVRTCTTSSLTCTITGLTNGTTYYIDVKASNDSNATFGAASSPRVSVTPRTVPSAPTSVSATAGQEQTAVTWTASASSGGSPITTYVAQAWTAASGGTRAATCEPVVPTGLGCTITGLTGGTPYYVDVISRNAAGDSTASSPRVAVMPTTAPSGGGGGGGGSSSSGGPSDGGGGGGSIWTVKEVRPSFGSTAGGDTILVLGWGFTGATGVSVGGRLAPSFTLINDATIQIVTPPGTVGWQELRVWLPNGSVPAGFEYRDIPAASGPGASVPTTPAPPAQSVPGGAGGTRVPVGPASSPILKATAAETAAADVLRVRQAVATRASRAPRVRLDADTVVHLGVRGLAKASRIAVQVRIGNRYVPLGRVRSSTAGRATLPGFVATEPGSYRLRLKAAGTPNRYLTLQVR
ncbi:MAG: S8 family serine peptidase [Actinomycetales bacterium]|nr:S8 family serine peptidase [Actinomycetales bacterium]